MTRGATARRRVQPVHFEFAATGDATRIRGLEIYRRHRQASAIALVDHAIETFSASPISIHRAAPRLE
jgi:hypothetical protein